MIDLIKAYIKHIDQLYQTGVTTEHSFRGDLQQLLEDTTDYTVINEQKRIDCGAPDLALYKKKVPIPCKSAQLLFTKAFFSAIIYLCCKERKILWVK